MLSVRSLFQEILDNDESFRLSCSIAAGGEAQGGWENGRIAVLVPQSEGALAPRIARHGADEAEQRASEQMRLLLKHFADHPEVGRAVRMISGDEDDHLAHTPEELLRFAAAGHGRLIQHTLRACALAEIRVQPGRRPRRHSPHGPHPGWPRAGCVLLAAGIHAVRAHERLVGRRRMVTLSMPARRDVLGGPVTAAHELA